MTVEEWRQTRGYTLRLRAGNRPLPPPSRAPGSVSELRSMAAAAGGYDAERGRWLIRYHWHVGPGGWTVLIGDMYMRRPEPATAARPSASSRGPSE